ncbi:acyltransferase family protein [Ensifer adhaerens]|jgi:peptidoglycan/LPS O-acetylase OafA/YrhL|uniref:acyltransferase family protein n=1 Tax=Rhizobium sp. 11_C7_N12_5 TaxID=3240770 RepID=UPI0015689EA9|nr:hypothetical protein [Ensifer adhaerens]
METLGSRLDLRRGVAEGFDFLRLFLAVSVVAWHSFDVVAGLRLDDTPIVWVFGYSILSAFFALSGFLICGSALRLSLGDFLINRGLRIVPALALEIVLSALVLGPIFTTLPLTDYFRSAETWHYFTNIVGLINYTLPGVFQSHPEQTVNTSLWTVPHEIMCYVLMSILIFGKFLKRPTIIVLIAAAFLSFGLLLSFSGLTDQAGGIGKILYHLYVGPAARLYMFFLAGILFYLYRGKIPYSWPIFLGCTLFLLVCGFLPFSPRTDVPFATLFLALPLTYMTIFIGVTNIWIPTFCRKGDYSYGIYLYGWPLQQVVVSMLPSIHSVMIQFLVSIPLVFCFSMISWHLVERPILQLRKKFSFVARVRLGEAPQDGDVTLPLRGTEESAPAIRPHPVSG